VILSDFQQKVELLCCVTSAVAVARSVSVTYGGFEENLLASFAAKMQKCMCQAMLWSATENCHYHDAPVHVARAIINFSGPQWPAGSVRHNRLLLDSLIF
jgi:hypothetical protein